MRQLIERFDGFSYDYRMRCDCGAAVAVAAGTYFALSTVTARVPCSRCGGEVHFGPPVAMLRHENDPALDDGAVGEFAWYHSSTWADWPSAEHRTQTEAEARRMAHRSRWEAQPLVDRMTTQALHVGTYEAAIENMLRRMRDQADARSQFYLHRVQLSIGPGRINVGYRDENNEKAAQLTIGDLDEADVDAVRYLNVHEATGSLSIAVRGGCIVATQRLPIPVADLATPPSPKLLSDQLLDLEVRAEHLAQERAALPPLTPAQTRQMRMRRLLARDVEAERRNDIDGRTYELWDALDGALTVEYLGGVSPVIADAFCRAMTAWRRQHDCQSARGYWEHFAVMAPLLTRSQEVGKRLSQQPWRTPGAT